MMAHVFEKSIPADTLLKPVCGPACQQAAIAPPPASHNQVADFFLKLFNTDDFPARWHCGSWTDFHGWLYIISDLGIWAAYFAIPVLLLRVIIKRKDIPFNGMIILFLAFVFLCGLTHLLDALIFWWPAYRLSALVRFATAIVSLFAAYALSQVFPALLALRSVKELKLEIAKRKRTEERLSASEFLLSEAGRIARVGGWEYDLVTHKHNWSKTVYDILEVPYDFDIYTIHPLSYYPAPFRRLIEQATEDSLRNGTQWDIETPAVTINDKTLWVRHIGTPVFNQQGKIVKLRGSLMDIDQYKRNELELSRSLKATQEKTERLKKFGYILSHNIRNHTSNLAALAAMTEIEHLGDDNKDLILKSRKVTEALTTTLDDLADVIEAQDEAVARELISFEDVITRAVDAQYLEISQTFAQMTYTIDVPEIYYSVLYMDSIVRHLLLNALRFRDPAKVLQIEFKTCYNNDGNIVLECHDNGLGIDMELYGHKLFNLYATFHESLSARGVGLFLIKTQIETQGGEITVNSQPGQGTTFQVVFDKGLRAGERG